ncbi:MAG: GNAT family N-acetyltransferase [Allosphingosinicella sp.]
MIRYRAPSQADAAAIADLFERSFVETFAYLYRPEDLAAFLEQFTLDAWRAELADPALAFRLAFTDGVPAGFAKLGPVGLPVEPDGPAAELRQLYLPAAFHGLGIARALMEWVIAEARARGAETLYLSVWSGNARAKAFYRRYGFAFVKPYAFMVGEQADEDEIWRASLA